jgi:hypothetical protein
MIRLFLVPFHEAHRLLEERAFTLQEHLLTMPLVFSGKKVACQLFIDKVLIPSVLAIHTARIVSQRQDIPLDALRAALVLAVRTQYSFPRLYSIIIGADYT